jgi:RraA family protein
MFKMSSTEEERTMAYVHTAAPGRRLYPVPCRPAREAIDGLCAIPTPNISDSLGKLSPGAGRLLPYHRGGKLAGPAFTVRVPPGDNLLVYKAIAAAEPGDVLVIDAGGLTEQATIGEIMTTWAAQRGLAGIVVWGAVRDVDILARNDFPVYACGQTHRGPYKDGPGEINIPISIGGMLVAPGDLLVGDASGVVAVPFDDIDFVLREAAAIQRREDRLVADIEAGNYDSAWIDELLRERGYAV